MEAVILINFCPTVDSPCFLHHEYVEHPPQPKKKNLSIVDTEDNAFGKKKPVKIPNISKYKSWPTTDCYQMMIRHWSLWASACWIASHRGLSHASDSVVFCGTSSTSAFFDGERKFDRCQWKPVLPHELGRQSTAAAVACKTMGFSGSSRFSWCRRQRVRKGAASCFRFSLRGMRESRHAMLNEHRWQHVLCARRFSGYVLHRAWGPHWHACVSIQLAAAKTANHSVKSCGSTLFFCIVRLLLSLRGCMVWKILKGCTHVRVCAQCNYLLGFLRETYVSCLVQRFVRPMQDCHAPRRAGAFLLRGAERWFAYRSCSFGQWQAWNRKRPAHVNSYAVSRMSTKGDLLIMKLWQINSH